MEFALFDMEIYHQEDEGRLKEWPQILDKVRQEVAVTQPPAYNRFCLELQPHLRRRLLRRLLQLPHGRKF